MNKDLINNLNILKKYYDMLWIKNRQSKDNFRRLAYIKVINEIEKLDYNIKNINEVKDINGIGKSILLKIKEYIDNGKINKVEEIKKLIEDPKDKERAIQSFLNIWGVGIVKAESIWNNGYKTITDIINKPDILNRQQMIGLKYYDDLQKKIPRINIIVIETLLFYILNKTYGKNNYKLVVAGSYRRQKDFSNDIDILITSKIFCLKDIVYLLKKWNIISDILSMKNEKFMGIGNCPNSNEPYFRIDIEFLPENEFAYGLLYFTGSGDFNKKIRQYAKNKGFTLSQHGLKNNITGEFLIADTEKDIFELLGLKYLEPKERK